MENKSLSSEYPLVDAIINKIANSRGTPLTDGQIEQLEVMDIELRSKYVNIAEKIEKEFNSHLEKEVTIITPNITIFQNRDNDKQMDKRWQYIIHFKYFQFNDGVNLRQPKLVLWIAETELILKIRFRGAPYILLYSSDDTNAGMLRNVSNNNLQERCLPIKF